MSWRQVQAEHAYSYDDALELAGGGRYSAGLLLTLSIVTLAMGVDMFGFSVVVRGSACEFHLSLHQTSVLLSMPFVGPIAMAFWWGYVSDRRGRRASLLVAMWASFLAAAAGAFSPNWIVMAILKFISTSLCSCAQSATYTLLGESCPRRLRDGYMLLMTSVLEFSLAAYIAVAYFILELEFSYDLGWVTFSQWRLLALSLALPLGCGAAGLHCFYESPKFLLNAGRAEEALENLRGIWRWNGGRGLENYQVKRVYLEEEGNERPKDESFIQSLWMQVAPFFKPPLLIRSFQLYFLTAVLYGTNNAYFIWFPFLAESFGSEQASSDGLAAHSRDMCGLILARGSNGTHDTSCPARVPLTLVWSSLAQGSAFVVLLLAISLVARKKKFTTIAILAVSCAGALGAVTAQDHYVSLIMFFGLLLNGLCIGFIFSYFVELYPTSYRGTASCFGVLVARTSALVGVNLLGAHVLAHCALTFYSSSALLLCACVVAAFLPPDTRN